MTVDKPNATPETTAQQAGELAAMRRMLEVSRGTFSLSIAVCNSPALRDYLIQQLQDSFPDIAVVSISDEVSDPYGFVKTQLADRQPAALFVTDLERTIPSQATDQPALHSLNASRELWEQRSPCPVVFWLPEYAATLLSTSARDFWRYRSHRFEFVSEFATAANALADRFSGNLAAASNLSQDEKRFRIAELEQRLAEVDVSSEPAMATHVIRWLNELGWLYFTLGELDDAMQQWQTLSELAHPSGPSPALAFAYGNLGSVLHTRGDLDKAEAMHRKALEVNKKLERLEGMASDYGNLGIVLETRGDLDAAEAMYRKALEINEKLRRPQGLANQYGNLGNVMRRRSNLDEAETMYRKALEANERIGQLEGIAGVYGNLGIILKSRGDLDEAEAMFRKALEIEDRLGRLKGIANQYGNLGSIMEKRGKIDAARAFWIQSRDLFDKLGAKHMVAQVQGWIDSLTE